MTTISYNQFIIIKKYIEARNIDRFYAEDDILKAEAVDYDRASARFLGREIARMAGQTTKDKLTSILERESCLIARPQDCDGCHGA